MSTDQRRVALITGSGRRRVGNVIAHWMADRGFDIALHYNNSRQAAKATVDGFTANGTSAAAFKADVSDEQQVDAMFEQVVERFGRLDLLVTTASIWPTKSLELTTADDVRKSFDVNTLGTFLCARRAGLIMAQQPSGGAIVTIGDWAIQRPYEGHAAYFIAKGAIGTLTRMLAVELAQRNPKVRVNCIHPGPVMLPDGVDEQERRTLIDATLVKNVDHPQAVAQAVQFFVENEFVTGACLPVDGGRTIYAGEA